MNSQTYHQSISECKHTQGNLRLNALIKIKTGRKTFIICQSEREVHDFWWYVCSHSSSLALVCRSWKYNVRSCLLPFLAGVLTSHWNKWSSFHTCTEGFNFSCTLWPLVCLCPLVTNWNKHQEIWGDYTASSGDREGGESVIIPSGWARVTLTHVWLS